MLSLLYILYILFVPALLVTVYTNDFCNIRGCPCETLFNYISIDCSFQNYTTFPTYFPPNTITLILRGNNITDINRTQFRTLPNLRVLDLHGNNIKRIESNVFVDLHQLTNLSISAESIASLALNGLTNLNILTIDGNHILSTLPASLLKSSTYLENVTITNTNVKHISNTFFRTLKNMRRLNLRRNQLETIPLEVFAGNPILEMVDLSYNQLRHLPVIFKTANDLNYFNISYNQLSSIDKDVFLKTFRNPVYFPSGDITLGLAIIDLSNNNLKKIPPGLFKQINQIHTLNLQRNNLTSLPIDTFNATSNGVTSLDLSHNPIQVFPLQQLQNLGLRELRLRNISQSVLYLYKLSWWYMSTLDMSMNCLKNYTLPSAVDHLNMSNCCLKFFHRFTNNYAESIDLSNNELTSFDLDIREIEFINLSFNQISRFSLTNNAASGDTIINLSHNNISNISNLYISNNSYVARLNLSHNALTSLDGFMAGCSNRYQPCSKIVGIDVSYNQLEAISPISFATVQYSRLLWLNLEGNNIKRYNASTFKYLLTLNLVGNGLSNQGMIGAYRKLPRLQQLFLRKNKLTTVPKSINYLKNLETLDLSLNNIENISQDAFQSSAKLKSIALNGNRLTTLPSWLFKNSSRLEVLDLSKNSLVCSCNITVIMNKLPTTILKGQCSGKNTTFALTTFRKPFFTLLQTRCNLCPLYPCHGNGECLPEVSNGFICECNQTHVGQFCNVTRKNCYTIGACSTCTATRCQQDSNCEEISETDYKCHCKNKYIGKDCQNTLCLPSPCLNQAGCTTNGESYKCDCKSTYTGRNCENRIPRLVCNESICKNNGSCIETSAGGFKCVCTSRYTGTRCENVMETSCASNPCLNQGICALISSGKKCICTENYTGSTCETRKPSPCKKVTCRNNGICIENGNMHKCICNHSYSGLNCETRKLSLCKNVICRNNGTCVETANESFQCLCSVAYTGRHCQHFIDDVVKKCSSNPCKNFAVCLSHHGNAYTCKCRSNFTGKNCESKLEPQIIDHFDKTKNTTTASSSSKTIGIIIGGVLLFLVLVLIIFGLIKYRIIPRLRSYKNMELELTANA